jgi:hypothetical protein
LEINTAKSKVDRKKSRQITHTEVEMAEEKANMIRVWVGTLGSRMAWVFEVPEGSSVLDLKGMISRDILLNTSKADTVRIWQGGNLLGDEAIVIANDSATKYIYDIGERLPEPKICFH